ncbi:MAG: peptide deformylase [Planctomycetota bacterium]|jgi:peptide deformylase
MEIVKYPDPVLEKKGEPVEESELTDEFRETLKEMFKLMYKGKGVGLAAQQVGIPKLFFVMNLTGKPEDEAVCINPEIVDKEGTLQEEEGCLSFPGLCGKVLRSKKLDLEYTDASGARQKKAFEGLGARAVQHEFDHINGVLFTTRLSPAARSAMKAKLNEMEREYAEPSK